MDLTLARKWNSLGVPVIGMYLHQIREDLKFATKVEDLSDKELEGADEKDYNCLALFISKTNLICLDINNEEDSIPLFHEYLKSNGADISDFYYETTMNDGLHLYFINQGFKKNLYKHDNEGIKFDLLCQGRVFTSPTSYGEGRYSFGKKTPMQLTSVDQIGKMPNFLVELVEYSHHIPLVPRPVFL